MKKNRRCLIIGLMAFFLLAVVAPASFAAAVNTGKTGAPADKYFETTAYLQDIAFEKLPGKERVILVFSEASGAIIENRNAHSVIAIMANTYIPEDFRQPLGVGKLDNVHNISASQQDKDGQPWGYVTMEMKERVPYMVRKDGVRILIDFNVPGFAGKANRPRDTGLEKRQGYAARNAGEALPSGRNQGAPDPFETNLNKLISIDFQEANIKSVLRLLAEEGGVSIASGDDVKGNVTLTLKKVTWQEAFETVLAVQGLGKVKEGDVFIVKTIDRMRKEEKTKSDEAADRVKRQVLQEIAEQEKRVKDGRLPQISIEAKIVEVTRSGSRDLGILWGTSWKNRWGGKDVGFIFGNSPVMQGQTTSTDITTPSSGSVGLAVNFPSATTTPNPALGVIVSSANAVLAAKLEALESVGDGRIVSAPKVTTLDNEKAKIGQGEEIPYVSRDEDGVQKVEMKDAKLELEVTPKITSEGKISMKVLATNKAADWNKVNKNDENPPLVASNVESKVVVSDGDTLVLGGIMKKYETTTTTGIPFLSKIPVMGWLFKSQSDLTEERELLIFITPRIVKET